MHGGVGAQLCGYVSGCVHASSWRHGDCVTQSETTESECMLDRMYDVLDVWVFAVSLAHLLGREPVSLNLKCLLQPRVPPSVGAATFSCAAYNRKLPLM